MSGAQESPGDVDLDPEVAMREMMGFSSFTTRPKNRSDTNNAQTLPQAPPKLHEPINHRKPSANPDPTAVSMVNSVKRPGNQQQHLTTSLTPEATTLFATQQHAAYAFTSPQSGIAYTKQELQELMLGKMNVRGDKVYFKPGFVDEDPWSRLRRKEQGSDNTGGSRGKRSREHETSAEVGVRW